MVSWSLDLLNPLHLRCLYPLPGKATKVNQLGVVWEAVRGGGGGCQRTVLNVVHQSHEAGIQEIVSHALF